MRAEGEDFMKIQRLYLPMFSVKQIYNKHKYVSSRQPQDEVQGLVAALMKLLQ